MKVNHNISALVTNNSLNKANNQADKSMKRLSTGLRINSAADDAAGMAISQKLKTQVRGLKVASRNSLDGISLVQTAEGALNEVQNMLQRMRELSIQAANDTLQSEDRKAIQLEINQLITEIDDTSKKTEFNKIKLLNGDSSRATASSNSDMAVCTYVSDTVNPGSLTYDITKVGTPAMVKSEGANFNTETDPITGYLTTNYAGKLTINGEIIEIKESDSINDITNKMKELCDRAGIDIIVTGGGTWEDWQDGSATLMFVTQEAGSRQIIDIASDNTALLNAIGFYNTGANLNTHAQGTDAEITNVIYNGKNVLASCKGNEIEITADAGQVIRLKFNTEIDALSGTLRMPVDGTGGTYVVALGTANAGEVSTLKTASVSPYEISYLEASTSVNAYEYSSFTWATETNNVNCDAITAIEVSVGSSKYVYNVSSLPGGLSDLAAALRADGIDAYYDSTAPAPGKLSILSSSDNVAIRKVATSAQPVPAGSPGSGSLASPQITFVSNRTTQPLKISIGTDTVDIPVGSTADYIATLLTDKFSARGLTFTGSGTTISCSNTGTAASIKIEEVRNLTGAVTRTVDDDAKRIVVDKVIDTVTGKVVQLDTKSAIAARMIGGNLSINGMQADQTNAIIVASAVPGPATNPQKNMELTLLDFGPLVLHVGPNENMTLQIQLPNLNADGLGIRYLNLRSREGAEAAIPVIDEALSRVADIRARLGAYQNRLEYTVSNLDATQENATASLSRVEDTDMAEEMSEYTQKNVLVQAATSILAQANQRPQQILQLLQ